MRQSSLRSLVYSLGLLALASPLISVVVAQQAPPAPPAALINTPDDPLLRGFRWRSIGPVGQGGRIDDIAADEKNPTTYYIGFAVGGVVKTTNNGTTFTSIFDTYGAASIADIAIAPSNPDILYVATGEANNRQTTSYGDGLYKSTDGGKTFVNVGFKDSQTLGRVLIHPRDPNIAWIAVGGHLYGSNADRGVYMTADGGKTWTKTLYVDEYTSATEIAIDPSNPLNLWAAMYQRQRTAWGFNGGGPGSGIYQSVDGGKKWTKVTAPGLPKGTLGRVALDFCKAQPNVIYAQIEAALDKEPAVAAGAPAATPAPPAGRAGAAGTAVAGAPPPLERPRVMSPLAPARVADAAVADRPIRSTPACSNRSTRAARGRSSRTRTSARCTSARSASIRTTATPCTSAAWVRPNRLTAARPGRASTTWATWTTTRSGSIRSTVST